VQTFGPSDKLLRTTGHDLVRSAKQTPAGMARVGEALGLDTWDAAHGRNGGRSAALAKGMGHATLEDLQHPLRHPGYTLLDLLALAGTGASVAPKLARTSRIAAKNVRSAARNAATHTRPKKSLGRALVDPYVKASKTAAQQPYRSARYAYEHPPRSAFTVYRRGGQAERVEYPRKRFGLRPH
jgi:hypothetical protein